MEQPKRVSQQAMSQRLTSLPSELFLRVLMDILPIMRDRWMAAETSAAARTGVGSRALSCDLGSGWIDIGCAHPQNGLLKVMPEINSGTHDSPIGLVYPLTREDLV